MAGYPGNGDSSNLGDSVKKANSVTRAADRCVSFTMFPIDTGEMVGRGRVGERAGGGKEIVLSRTGLLELHKDMVTRQAPVAEKQLLREEEDSGST